MAAFCTLRLCDLIHCPLESTGLLNYTDLPKGDRLTRYSHHVAPRKSLRVGTCPATEHRHFSKFQSPLKALLVSLAATTGGPVPYSDS